MKNATWLEVAINGPWSRNLQPNIPISANEIVEDAVACISEGASVIHFHAYDETSGRQRDDYEIYAPIIERIRAKSDVICYGTLPFLGSSDAQEPQTPNQRFRAVEKLARAGLIEWSVVDPGSTNISTYSEISLGNEGFVYTNPESHIRYGLELAQRLKISPSYAIYEPGFLRLGSALHRQYSGAPTPIYRFMFSQQMTFGFPPTEWALDSYLKLLDFEQSNAPWMIAGLGVELDDLVQSTVERGGNVRVGLEDAPMGCDSHNVDLVKRARRQIESVGGTIAVASNIRDRLKAS